MTPAHELCHGTVEAMSQRVARLTDRKFEIQVFAGGEIVPPLQVWDATASGWLLTPEEIPTAATSAMARAGK